MGSNNQRRGGFGLDGRYYESYDSYQEANARYKQHQEQKALLEEQNYLLEEQNRINQKLELEKMKQLQEIELQRNNMQREQMEHEEKMRLLGLFDSVGIPKETYDNFVKGFFNNSIEELKSIESEKALILSDNFQLNKDLKELEKCMEDLNNDTFLSFYDCSEKYQLDTSNQVLTEEEKEKIQSWIEDPEEYKEELLKYDVYDYVLEHKGKAYGLKALLFWFALPLTMGIGLFLELDDTAFAIMFFGDLFLAIYFTVKFGINKEKEPDLDTKLGYVLNRCKNLYFKDDNKKCIRSLIKTKQKEINDIKEFLSKREKEIQKNIDEIILENWNDFINFRKEHYNSSIEKILLDAGFKEKIIELGFDYPKINSSNKVKDGTIEDYIAYFDNFS